MVAPSAGLAVILAAAAALGAGGGGEGKSATRFEKELEIMAKGGRAVAIGELLREMAASGDPKAIALIPAAGVALFSHKNYEAAVEAIAGLEDEAAVQALAGVLRRAKDYRQRTLVLEAFGKRSDAATLEAIAAEVKSGIVHVQVAAIRAARARKERGPIGPLVEVLEGRWKARDRTWYEAR
ncbi:MAG: hypothetical protein HY721_05080, partial [Planctomycetes bacterium]|nr:hypothetical protein [Planctomycetota bacterium]